MEGSKTCSTPTTPGKTLSRYEGEAMADPTVYCSTIGALQYLIVRHFIHCEQVNYYKVLQRFIGRLAKEFYDT